jgi:hypothetical protein
MAIGVAGFGLRQGDKKGPAVVLLPHLLVVSELEGTDQ